MPISQLIPFNPSYFTGVKIANCLCYAIRFEAISSEGVIYCIDMYHPFLDIVYHVDMYGPFPCIYLNNLDINYLIHPMNFIHSFVHSFTEKNTVIALINCPALRLDGVLKITDQ